MKKVASAALIYTLISASAQAQPAQPAPASNEPIVAQIASAPQGNVVELPANTEIMLSVNEELNSRRNRAGDMFGLTVVHDVRIGDYVVIPRGTRAVGEITWRTGKGAFGKSGKMDIALRYIDLNGRRIEIEGTYRQEGEGNTVATVAGVIAVGVFAVFITGRSARVPPGRELAARTRLALPVVLPDGASVVQSPLQATTPPAPTAVPVQPQ